MSEGQQADSANLRSVFGRFPTGVAVVGVRTAAGAAGGMTANALCSLSLDPLLVLVCFEREARTLPLVEEAGRFSLSVLGEDAGWVADRFASKLGEEEKLEGIAHRDEDGLPVLDDAVAWLTASVSEVLPGGDHAIVIGAVETLGEREGQPLIWERGRYTRLADDGRHSPVG